MTKSRAIRILVGLIAIPAVGLVSAATYAGARWDRTFEAPYPDLRASTDADTIETGRYLVFGPAHCGACHAPPEDLDAVAAGAEVPLAGGYEWELPLGVVRAPNITPDHETGIGRYTDGELARVLRHGVKPNGRAAIPFMEFQNLSDADIVAILSYLRSVPAVRNEVQPTQLTLVGRGVMAALIRPVGPADVPRAEAPESGPTVERGEYLVNSVAGCAACHSQRNMVDGSYSGPRLAGGSPTPSDVDPEILLTAPNLTPDPVTGHIRDWTREEFIARFRAGALRKGSKMPWTLFARMSDPDLEAVYLYLQSLDPVHHDTGPIERRR